MERVAYHLSHSLRKAHLRLLGGTAHDMFKGGNNSATKNPNHVGAFALLNLVYPYIRFAHFTANQSIFEAVDFLVRKVGYEVALKQLELDF